MRRIVIVWGLLAGLIGVIVVLEQTDLVHPRRGPASTGAARLLLPVPVDQLAAVEVARDGTLHRFERDAGGAWLYHGAHAGSDRPHAHTGDPGVAERIDRALRAFGRTRIERHVTRADDLAAYGITTTRILILVYRPNETQPVAQYAVGDLAPDTVSRYVEVVGGPGVVTIPDYQIRNLLALVDAVAADVSDGTATAAAADRPGSRPAPGPQ